MNNYSEYKELFSVDSGPVNEAKNVSNILECFELFFDKDVIKLLVTETDMQNIQIKEGISLHSHFLCGLGFLSQKNEICMVNFYMQINYLKLLYILKIKLPDGSRNLLLFI